MPCSASEQAAASTDTYDTAIRTLLRTTGEVASKATLRAATDVPDWYIDQLTASDSFYTSLTHNGRYVASKFIVGRRADHQGFWRPEADGETVVFHRQESTTATLKHLCFRRPSGVTAAEATDLLGRRCYRALTCYFLYITTPLVLVAGSPHPLPAAHSERSN